MTPLPFASQSYQNRSLPASAQRCVNIYPEIVEEGKTPVVLHGTPGLKSFSTDGGGQVRGLHVFNRVLYAVIGVYFYRVSSSGELTELGLISGNGRVSMANDGSKIAIVNGEQGYVWDGSTLNQIYDVDFPMASTCQFINQRIIYDSQYGFTYTELDGPETMEGTVNAAGSPDEALSLLVDHLEVWVFNESSVEVWYNSGDVVDPFQRLQGAYLEKGCGAKYSPAKADNTVYWLGDDFAVYRAEGYAPVRISTPAVEHDINTYSKKDDAFSFVYYEENHTFYWLTFPSAKKTWVYDAATQRWHERSNQSAGRHRANCYAYVYGKHLVGDFENGTIWELDQDTYLDGAEEIQRIAITPPIHANGEDIFNSKIWIDFESGTGLTTGQGEDPQAMLNHSDDGGRTWSNERWTTIGKKGKYKNQAIWRRNGTFNQRIFQLQVSDPVKFAMTGAYGDF